MGFSNCSMFCCSLLCLFQLCNHLDGVERADCFALFVFLVSRDCCVVLPHDTTGLTAVCDCGISVFPDHTHLLFLILFTIFDSILFKILLEASNEHRTDAPCFFIVSFIYNHATSRLAKR